MPAEVMTFDSLIEDLKDYLERGDLSDETVIRQLPRRVNNTERYLASVLKIQGYLGVYTSTMQAGEPRISKPQTWRSTVSINYGRGVDFNSRFTLRARSYEYMRSIYPSDQSLNAPELYCDYNIDTWLVLPAPADDYPFEANIYQLPALLDSTNQENYLTRYAPDALLYSCLIGMEPFLRNDTRIPVWKDLAAMNLKALDVEDIRRMVDRAQTRSTD
jgi:hypothetical protein